MWGDDEQSISLDIAWTDGGDPAAGGGSDSYSICSEIVFKIAR